MRETPPCWPGWWCGGVALYFDTTSVRPHTCSRALSPKPSGCLHDAAGVNEHGFPRASSLSASLHLPLCFRHPRSILLCTPSSSPPSHHHSLSPPHRTVRQMIDHGARVLTPQWLVATCRHGRVGDGRYVQRLQYHRVTANDCTPLRSALCRHQAVACEPYLYDLADDPDPAEPVVEEKKPKPKPKPAPGASTHPRVPLMQP